MLSRKLRAVVLYVALVLGLTGGAVALAAGAAAASGSGSTGVCSSDYNFVTYTHSSRIWLTQATCSLKFRIGVYCIYPFGYHDWVQGPYRYGNGNSGSNYSQAVCNTYGQGSPVDIDFVYYLNGSYHTQRVYTG